MKGFMGKVNEWIQKHSLITAGILFVITMVVVGLVVFFIVHNRDTEPAEKDGQTADVTSESEQNGERYALIKNGNEEITAIAKEYQDALANNNKDVIKKYVEFIKDSELDNIDVKSEYVESYNNIECYTQMAEKEGSYYVYISYMLKMKDYETYIPGLTGLYFEKGEDDNYHIYRKNDMDEAVLKDFYAAFLQQDVQDLYKNIDMKYNVCLDADEDLKNYMNGFEDMVKDEMAKRIVIREASEQLEAAASEAAASEAAASEAAANGETTEVKVKTTTTVNVRSSDSETADKLGKAASGQELVRLEERVNGWSKVLFEGKEGYIKSEFLVEVGTETTAGNGTGQYVTVKENVNIRKTASQDADRVALAVAGEKLELIEKMSNGWTKIKYNGKEAYVKSEFLQ